MKTVIINGQNHKGSTYHIGKLLADKIGGEVTEFFLPRDFSDYCIGCAQCFSVAADKCHWCNVAIVERLNRYRGISQKRSVKSSCIGWLSCMLGKPSQRYRHTSTGSVWEKVQDL
jgi:hypothetical protein